MMEQFLTIILIAVVGIVVALGVIAVGMLAVMIWIFIKDIIEEFL